MKKFLVLYLKTYHPKVDTTRLKFIGSGMCAMAYRIDNKVYKITTDLEDYLIATKRQNMRVNTFAKVYFTDAIESTKTVRYVKNMYVICTKYEGRTARKQFSRNYRMFSNVNDLFFQHYEYKVPLIPLETLMQYTSGRQAKKLTPYIYKAYQKIAKDFDKLTPHSFDYHAANVCWNSEKKTLKVIDFGYSGTKDFTGINIKYKKL